MFPREWRPRRDLAANNNQIIIIIHKFSITLFPAEWAQRALWLGELVQQWLSSTMTWQVEGWTTVSHACTLSTCSLLPTPFWFFLNLVCSFLWCLVSHPVNFRAHSFSCSLSCWPFTFVPWLDSLCQTCVTVLFSACSLSQHDRWYNPKCVYFFWWCPA